MRRLSLMSGLLALSLAMAACGSSDSGNSPSGGGGGGGGPSPSGAFVGSCKLVTTTTAGGATTTATTCTDYMMQTADDIQKLCANLNHQNEMVTVVATYSADHCSTAGMAGKCTTATVVYYNDNATNGQAGCSAQGGTWTAL